METENQQLIPCFQVNGEYIPISECEDIKETLDIFGYDTYDFKYQGQFYFSYLHHKQINK